MKKFLLILFAISTYSVNAQIQYADSVLDFSTEYDVSDATCSADYAACRALGAYDVYPAAGDDANAWAHEIEDGSTSPVPGREWLSLGFGTPQVVDSVFIYQTLNPGFIDTVYIRDSQTKVWNIVYTNSSIQLDPDSAARILIVSIPVTSYLVDGVRITMDASVINDWKEIDAIGISGTAPSGIKNIRSEQISFVASSSASGSISVAVNSMKENSLVSVYNMLGSKVGSELIPPQQRAATIEGLNSGVYFVEVYSGNGKAVKKVLVH